MILKMDLLDALTMQANCDDLSDLKRLNCWQKVHLARELVKVPADAAELRKWNDALEYLTGAPPCADAEQARSALIAGLSAV